jgi:hypothetical protein
MAKKDRFLTVCGQIPLHKLQQLRIHVCHHDLLRTADAAADGQRRRQGRQTHASALQKNATPFLSFPYGCPEPVLVN